LPERALTNKRAMAWTAPLDEIVSVTFAIQQSGIAGVATMRHGHRPAAPSFESRM